MKARLAVAGAVGIPVAAVGLAVWDPARHGGPAVCPWRVLTGSPCPGCGLTRAGGALLRGRVDEAIQLHPLVLLVAVQVVALWVLAIVVLRRTRRDPRPQPAWVTPLLLAEAVAFVGVWGARVV
jgi:hypothetical protein